MLPVPIQGKADQAPDDQEQDGEVQDEENTAIEVMDLGRSMLDSKPPGKSIDESGEQGEVEVQLLRQDI